MKKTVLAIGGLALTLALAACGSDNKAATNSPAPAGQAATGSAYELLSQATDKTAQVKTVKMSIESTALGQVVKGEGQSRFDGGNIAMSFTMNVLGEETGMRIIDKTMYMQIAPAARSVFKIDKPWGKVSLGDALKGSPFGGSADQMESSDPRKSLESLKKAGTITKSEQTQLDGQEVTHYWVFVELAKIDGSLQGLPKEQLDKIKDKVKGYDTEVWLNKDQLPVQVISNPAPLMEAMGIPKGMVGPTTVKYHDWGAPVDVQAPPADQVADLDLTKFSSGGPGIPAGPNTGGLGTGGTGGLGGNGLGTGGVGGTGFGGGN